MRVFQRCKLYGHKFHGHDVGYRTRTTYRTARTTYQTATYMMQVFKRSSQAICQCFATADELLLLCQVWGALGTMCHELEPSAYNRSTKTLCHM